MSTILVDPYDLLTMIEFYRFEREAYTLVVIESRGFTALDVERWKNAYPSVDETKGVAIAGAPETDWTLISDLLSYYRTRSLWQGAYNPNLHGILVGNSFSNIVRGEVIKTRLPCLECFRLGVETEVKVGSRHPYCTGHLARSPHRAGSRSRKA
jgi:hypothetical protein